MKNDYDMLQGNINRMMITYDYNELKEMKKWAIKRIENIYKQKVTQLYEIMLNDDINEQNNIIAED